MADTSEGEGISAGYIKYALLACMLLWSSHGFPSEVPEQSECRQLKASQDKLNDIYKKILSKHASDQRFIKKFKLSQRAWATYRDAQVELVFPHGDSAEYGSIYGECRCHTLDDLTRERIKLLDQWLTGIDMGDVCTGSRPIEDSCCRIRHGRRGMAWSALAQRIEQRRQPVVIQLQHQRQQPAQLAVRKALARKPREIRAGQVGDQSTLILAVRHAHAHQLRQVFRFHEYLNRVELFGR